jgi:cytochrome c oxidase subunit 2
MRLSRIVRAMASVWGVVAVAALALLPSAIAFAQVGQPTPITDEARSMHRLYIVVLSLAFAVFVGVVSALLFAIFRYRRRRADDPLPPQIHGSAKIEAMWIAIPVIIVLTMFTYSAVVLAKTDRKAPEDALTIRVTGFQFQWQFDYNLQDLGSRKPVDREGTVTILGTPSNIPELVIPVDEPVEFVLHSNDVIHSFFIPNFLYKLDVIPGLENRFVVVPRVTGTFRGQCAELCGVDHALMLFTVRVVTREEFDRWIVEQAAETASGSADASAGNGQQQ